MSANFNRIILSLILSFICLRTSYATEAGRTARVCINKDTCVIAQIADTDQLRIKGLMFKKAMTDSEAMLFIFPEEGRYSFWMMNMRIALDIIWIDRALRIVDMRTNLAPCADGPCESVLPGSNAHYVLEVPAGFTLRHHITIGNTVSINN